MASRLDSTRNTLGIAERRTRTRTLVTTPMYVDLGKVNGGLVFSLSEDGLALTAACGLIFGTSKDEIALAAAANIVRGDGPLGMRIQMQDAGDWIEATGQIAWRSESGKTVGVKFIALPDHARQRIEKWLAKESDQGQPQPKGAPRVERPPANDAPARTPTLPLQDALNSNTVLEKSVPETETEKAREKIAAPISREESQEASAQNVKTPDGSAIHPEERRIPRFKIPVPADMPAGSVAQEHSQGPVPSRPVAPSMRVAQAPARPIAPGALRPTSPKKSEFKLKPKPVFRAMTSGGGTKRLGRLAATLILAGVTAAAIGWAGAAPAVRNGLIAFIAKNTKSTNKPTEVKKPVPEPESADVRALQSKNNETRSNGIERIPADRPANRRKTDQTLTRPQVRTADRLAASPRVTGAVRRDEGPSPKNQPAKLPERAVAAVRNPAVASAPSQAVENSRAQPKETTVTAATSSSASVPSGTTLPEVKESAPPLPKQPVAPMGPTWSVAVSTDPYPSIRIPANASPQKASQGKNLQIGRAISRVEPVYPEEAKRQGIEGAVRLHVIVGGDGAVQSVALTGGPALLAKAAASAIREWRYAQTLVGGQPVETEQDVVVTFRLVSRSNSEN